MVNEPSTCLTLHLSYTISHVANIMNFTDGSFSATLKSIARNKWQGCYESSHFDEIVCGKWSPYLYALPSPYTLYLSQSANLQTFVIIMIELKILDTATSAKLWIISDRFPSSIL